MWLLSVFVFSAGLLLAPTQTAWADPAGEPTRPTQHAKVELKSDASEGINPALRRSASLVSSSNMLHSPHAAGESSGQDKWRVLLEVAQQQHVQKDYSAATRNLTAIMEAKTADEMKRSALIELAVMAQEQNQLAKAQQILAQYLRSFPGDFSVPEVLLRQGLLYRQMGAPGLALSKFYAVMTSALTLKHGRVDYYQRLVLQAQTEIAETYYWQGKHEEAAEFFSRLLKLGAPDLNIPQIQLKLLRCLSASAKHSEAIAQAEDFLAHHPGAAEEPEARFLLANSLKRLGRNKEARQQVLLLLQSQQNASDVAQATWIYWQQRAGNEIANQIYQEGDYLGALEIYSALSTLDKSPAWQLPVWYQMGLIYERLQQPSQASATYARMMERQKELASDARPGLKTVLDMAKWRNDFLDWQAQSAQPSPANASRKAPGPGAATP